MERRKRKEGRKKEEEERKRKKRKRRKNLKGDQGSEKARGLLLLFGMSFDVFRKKILGKR